MTIPFSVAVEGAAAGVVPDEVSRDWFSRTVGEARVINRFPAGNVHLIETGAKDIPVVSSGITPTFIDEGDAKPVSDITVTKVTVPLEELAVVVAVSDRLVRESIADVETMIANETIKGFARRLDESVLGRDCPASWDNMTDLAVAAGHVHNGSTFADVYLLVSDMLADLEANENLDEGSLVWFVKRTVKQYFRDARTTTGAPLVETMMLTDGPQSFILDHPVVYVDASRFPTGVDIILADMSKLALGRQFGALQYDESREASYDPGTGNLRSAFERNETVYKWYDMYGVVALDDEGCSLASGVAYVGS